MKVMQVLHEHPPGLNEPRNVAMYLMRHLRGDTLSTICEEFGLKKDSSAGSIVDRVKKQILKDDELVKSPKTRHSGESRSL